MLGRLIQTAATYGRGNNTLESATEESHTRNLLYGQSHLTYSLTQSPPTSPYATPIFRPGSFDDRGGLELEEKDVRILIAQDAGVEDKPALLFDSRANSNPVTPFASHSRHASMVNPRSPLPNDWKFQAQYAATPTSENPFRTRSSLATGGAAPWVRPARDTGTREDTYLECMFGVTSSTKTASTTKMHILPGKSRSTTAKLDAMGRSATDQGDQPYRRAPLQRSRTSNTVVRSANQPSVPAVDVDAQSQDSILITRLFSITLSETVAPTLRSTDGPISPTMELSVDNETTVPSPTAHLQHSKKPKLVERKVPAFAVGLVINLPRNSDFHPAPLPARPTSRSAHAHPLSSASSSYGSDMQSSWSFLNAIPETLASSNASIDDYDKRIDMVVNNEDVILRAMTLLEAESSRILHEQLQKVLKHATTPEPKTPKEKSMQRTNQRIISISDPTAIAKAATLQAAVKQVTRRVIYALRIPRVVTGSGFGVGHWADEARTAYRMCGSRHQNFFLFTLLTAFLGHHTQWLQRLAPEWYRKQHRAASKQQREKHALFQRTVIISDQRAIARRLIFLLASFIPGVADLDGLHKPGEDLSGSHFSVSSPSSHMVRNESLRRTANRRMREHRLNSNSNERALLSTSADSGESMVLADRSHRFLLRKNSDALSIRGLPLVSALESENARTINAASTSALTSHPATPVAVFSTNRGSDPDGYFPPFISHNESVATAGLANILRRNSSSLGNSSTVSSRWGSLVSGLSEMWSNKQHHWDDSGSLTAYSSATGSAGRHSTEYGSRRNKSNALQDMVDQLESPPLKSLRSPKARFTTQSPPSPDGFASPNKQLANTPRLRVDDKDGVVDVDLDLPGFGNFISDELFKSPSKSTNRSVVSSGRAVAESIRSFRSIPGSVLTGSTSIEANVAGYLQRHHEDFSLYAVRPYPELEDDLKRSMIAETTRGGPQDNVRAKLEPDRAPICTTIIADMRTMTIRKVTLQQKVRDSTASMHADPTSLAFEPISVKDSPEPVKQDMFVEEEIKDFDIALADAVERVLDLGDVAPTPPTIPPRLGHSRTASSGTMKSTPPSVTGLGLSGYKAAPREYVRQDCRQVVLGALENIAKDICDDISKLETGRDIHAGRSLDATGIKEEMKHENILREGVKCWLLDVEQPRIY